MLDVNAGIPAVDEPALLVAAIRAVMDVTDLPICIDSSIIEALEAGLSAYQGKALVNSVTAEEERMERILPLVKKHGAAVIGMANDETGISMVPSERLALARRIIERAADHGIRQEDVIIDPIAMTVAADPTCGVITLETMRLIRDELGNNMTCGASNVSFGLPDRATVIAMGSMITSSCCMPWSAARSTIRRASASRSSGTIEIPVSSFAMPMTAAPCFLTSGRIRSMRSSSAVTELTSALPS